MTKIAATTILSRNIGITSINMKMIQTKDFSLAPWVPSLHRVRKTHSDVSCNLSTLNGNFFCSVAVVVMKSAYKRSTQKHTHSMNTRSEWTMTLELRHTFTPYLFGSDIIGSGGGSSSNSSSSKTRNHPIDNTIIIDNNTFIKICSFSQLVCTCTRHELNTHSLTHSHI